MAEVYRSNPTVADAFSGLLVGVSCKISDFDRLQMGGDGIDSRESLRVPATPFTLETRRRGDLLVHAIGVAGFREYPNHPMGYRPFLSLARNVSGSSLHSTGRLTVYDSVRRPVLHGHGYAKVFDAPTPIAHLTGPLPPGSMAEGAAFISAHHTFQEDDAMAVRADTPIAELDQQHPVGRSLIIAEVAVQALLQGDLPPDMTSI